MTSMSPDTQAAGSSLIGRRSLLKLMAGASGSLLLAGASFGQTPRRSWIPDGSIEASIATLMEKHGVPGLALAVIEDGAVAWRGNYGVANVETGQPVRDDTLFQAASLSKPVFAYMVMQLVETGLLGLDARLSDYIRPAGVADEPLLNAITVKHVLQHTTGLPNWREVVEGAPLTCSFEPGTGYSYSGEAFHWLQQVVETILGKGFGDIAQDILFRPAGLDDMTALWTAARDGREVFGHGLTEDGMPELESFQYFKQVGHRLQEVAARWGRPMESWTAHDLRTAYGVMRIHDDPVMSKWPRWRMQHPGFALIDSASSVRCTAADYARFVTLMMPQGAPAPWQLPEATRKMMLDPHIDLSRPPHLLPPGLGWGIEVLPEGNLYSHWGKNGRSHVSFALGDARNRRGLTAMANGANGGPLIEEVAAKMTGVPYVSII